ncbi:glycosyltransferase [Roseomonas sp. HJA6]|uniref:Glycosyltransferase n=1 Tax=Roseomonas alba TaxID=2846776 RepID=A0ABS7A5N5_9PROT|nr:glycosyltransferase [Neoroseomonas alba]MBW6396484.1 glycosyltransferase [Neoroseomonas alba]
MTATPRVSIVIPTYNAAQWLPSSIGSALAQRFTDFELLVLDNASTDDTAVAVARFSDPRLIYRINDTNIGFAGNVHLGCRLARGDCILFLGADDILAADFLTEAVGFLDAHTDCSMVHGAAFWIDENGTRFGGTGDGWPRVTPGRQALVDVFRHGFCFTTMLMRTNLIRASGPFHEGWGEITDLWLFCRLCLAGNVGYIDKRLVDYRVHSNSISVPMYRTNSMFHRQMSAVRECFAWPEVVDGGSADMRALAQRLVARNAIEILHVSRADGYGRYLSNLSEIVRAVPDVLLHPESWARIGFGLLPVPAIRALARMRGRTSAIPTDNLPQRSRT